MAGAAASHRLRALILSKDFTRRYADALCCDQELEALLSADAATLHSKLACLGVPMLHKAPVAKLVREAQSVCEAAHGQADLKLAADESLSDGEAAAEGDGSASDFGAPTTIYGEAAAEAPAAGEGSADETLSGGAEAAADETDDEQEQASTESAQEQAERLRRREEARVLAQRLSAAQQRRRAEESMSEPSSEEVMPAKKARPFTASCLSDAAWVQFREKLLGKGGGAFPCLANGRVEVRRSEHGHGLGLFAGVDFKKGALLVVYGGELVTEAECSGSGSHSVAMADTAKGLCIDAAPVCAALLEQPDGAFAPKPGHEHLRLCGLAAAANHAEAATANAKLDRSPAEGALRAHFAPGEHDFLPPVPVLLAKRRIARGDEITWTYPLAFRRKLEEAGAW